jgi:hypothetical protein
LPSRATPFHRAPIRGADLGENRRLLAVCGEGREPVTEDAERRLALGHPARF